MNYLISNHEQKLNKTKLKDSLEDIRAVRHKDSLQIRVVVGEVKLKFIMGSRLYPTVLNGIREKNY